MYVQFLKLGAAAALPGLSEHFLIWDMDMVPLRPLPLLTRLPDDLDTDSAGGSQYQVSQQHSAQGGLQAPACSISLPHMLAQAMMPCQLS